MSMNGMKIWVMTLVEYDKFGNATVLQSFAKPAKDSPVKGRTGTKAPVKKDNKKKDMGEQKLW